MTLATVKKFFPERNYGFLFNPEGDKDIFFRVSGHFKEWLGELIPEPPPRAPTEGVLLKVLNKEQTPKGPRATKWTYPDS